MKNQSFATLSDRLLNRRALDQIIASWTTGLRADDVEILLQGRGIPAAAVKDSKGVCLDEQLAGRGYLIDIDHPVVGRTVVMKVRGLSFRRTPAMTQEPAPTIGGDNQQILEEILRYDEGRISELAETGCPSLEAIRAFIGSGPAETAISTAPAVSQERASVR